MTMGRKSMITPYKHCKKCGVLIVSGDLCEDCKPMTNGDKIRAMADEELVDAIGLSCQRCAYYYSRKDYDKNKKDLCRVGNLEWLKQEVSEDAGTDD